MRAQTFIPLKDCSHLVVVCGTTADDVPDLATLRAFVAGYGQGVSYRRNVWHHGLTILEDVAEFVVIISLTGRNDDDFFMSLRRPVEIQGTFSTVPRDQNG